MDGMNIRQEQAAATRKKLLESARQIFAEKGYKGASVRAINRNVNLADGLLYHYFPGGKKEIFQAVIEENKKEIFLAIDRLKKDAYLELPLAQLLERIYQSFVDLIDARIDIVRMFFREKDIHEFISKEQIMSMIGAKDPWIDDLLRKKYEMHEVRKMDFEIAAMEVRSILINHTIIKVATDCQSILEQPEHRKRIIDYQVSIWKS